MGVKAKVWHADFDAPSSDLQPTHPKHPSQSIAQSKSNAGTAPSSLALAYFTDAAYWARTLSHIHDCKCNYAVTDILMLCCCSLTVLLKSHQG